jgi:hydrogenase expression/formation protein HypE
MTHALIEKMFRPVFQGNSLCESHDGAVFPVDGDRMALTTDSHVVRPLIFPGGDIGTLSVYGTVNDLAMCGARPLAMSVGFIMEEGLEMETLWRIVRSMGDAAERAGIEIVTGDTKVVERGKGDGLYVNTTAVGRVLPGVVVSPSRVRPGDAVILSGDLGRHGVAILTARGDLDLDSSIESDCAPLWDDVERVLAIDPAAVHCMRDLTRGGLAAALVEIAETADLQIDIVETTIPLRPDVRGACELLGFDPLHLANEGRFALFVTEDSASAALQELNRNGDDNARVIGSVVEGRPGLVTLETPLGTRRVVSMLSGEQLPRIC